MLLRTRFYLPPLQANGVTRTGLLAMLNDTVGGELVLVSAPAGYGKTTLLSQWLHEKPHLFAWLVLDSTQSDPKLFWEYVISAIHDTEPSIGANAKQMLLGNIEAGVDSSTLNSHRIDLTQVLISFLNDLDAFSVLNSAAPITLVLDDFHKLAHPEIIRTFNLFLDHLPSALRVVVTARSEPQLNLARRRAQRQLVEFNQSQLAFSVDDTLRFFENAFGETFAKADVEYVVAKTEGWPTAIQLLALSLARNVRDLNLAGASKVLASCVSDALHKDIADYLFDEVFSMLAPELQGFLVKTACPSRFCASLANELTERFDGFDIIKNIDQSNLFLVPLDNHRTWYRYHDSFRQFLLQRFDSLPKQEQQKVRETAASWLENGGYLNIEIYDSFKGASMHTSPESTDLIELPELEPLTKRERQVMAYLKEGLSNKEIAAHLHISLNTLKVHIRNLYGKIGVENRTQALVKMKGLDNS